jgi:hypothetical protein
MKRQETKKTRGEGETRGLERRSEAVRRKHEADQERGHGKAKWAMQMRLNGNTPESVAFRAQRESSSLDSGGSGGLASSQSHFIINS